MCVGEWGALVGWSDVLSLSRYLCCFLDSVMTLEWPHYSKCLFFFKSCPVVVNFIPRLKALFLSCFTVFCFHWWLAHCWLNHCCFAAVKRLLKCVIRFVQTPRLPSLNKCAATDLDYLHFSVGLTSLPYSTVGYDTHVENAPLHSGLQIHAAVGMQYWITTRWSMFAIS